MKKLAILTLCIMSVLIYMTPHLALAEVGPIVDSYDHSIHLGITDEASMRAIGVPIGTSFYGSLVFRGSNFGSEQGKILAVGKEKGLHIVYWTSSEISATLTDGTTFDLGVNRFILRTAGGLESAPMEITIAGSVRPVNSVVSVSNSGLRIKDQADLVGDGYGNTGLTEGGVVLLTGTDVKQQIVSWTTNRIRIIIDNVPTRQPVTFTVGVPQVGKLIYSTPSEQKVISEIACTSWAYSDWGTCSTTGQQTRTITSATPQGCGGGNSSALTQACTPVRVPKIVSINPTSAYFNQEVDIIGTGFGNREILGDGLVASPGAIVAVDGQAGKNLINWTDTKIRIRNVNPTKLGTAQLVVSIPEQSNSNSFPIILLGACVEWQCGDFGQCQPDGIKTKICTKNLSCPNATAPMPTTTQSCIFVPPTCSIWTYSDWGPCSMGGQQTRTIVSSAPTGCSGGSPILSQSCTYIPPCTADTWSCGDWNQCLSDGRQSRSCTKTFDCSFAETSQPSTTQTCTPPRPQCTEDKWECGQWNQCSPNGIQTRSCKRTFDCPTVEDPSPTTSQSCDAPITTPNQPQQPQNQSENIDRDQIFRATVKLICPMTDKKFYSLGSGTVIDQYGSILTNRHVIQGTIGSCYVGFINSEDDIPTYNEIADAKKVSFDTSLNGDIALLKIRNPNGKQFSAIDIQKGNSDALRSGDTILPFGYPRSDDVGETITPTEGPYSGKGTTIKVGGVVYSVAGFFKTTATVEHGNSGGGAYQKKTGYYMGIPTLGVNKFNYILSVNAIKKWMNSLGGSYSVAKNNYSNIGNHYSSPVAIEDISLSNLQAIDSSEPTISIYRDNKKKALLVAKDGKFDSRIPTFFINGDQSQQGYYVYFGADKKVDPVKKGKFIRASEFTPPQIKKDGLYYFIFKVRDEKGSIGGSVITEYRYKK